MVADKYDLPRLFKLSESNDMHKKLCPYTEPVSGYVYEPSSGAGGNFGTE